MFHVYLDVIMLVDVFMKYHHKTVLIIHVQILKYGQVFGPYYREDFYRMNSNWYDCYISR